MIEGKILSMTEVKLKSFIDSLRPKEEEVRKKLDVGYSWDGQTALLFEIRPLWNDPDQIIEFPFAKLQFVKTSNIWRLYWLRASGKWDSYKPKPTANRLEELLDEIGNDNHSCFFG